MFVNQMKGCKFYGGNIACFLLCTVHGILSKLIKSAVFALLNIIFSQIV